MKKIILGLLSLLAVFLLLIGCTGGEMEVVDEEGNIIGEAARWQGKYQLKLKEPFVRQLEVAGNKLECKQFGNIDPSHTECQSRGYDTCAGATLIWSVRHDGTSDFITLPLNCDTPYREETYKPIVLSRLDLDESEAQFIDDDGIVTCCRIS